MDAMVLNPPGLSADAVRAAARAALARVAPLWPLARFVAVNPFLGLADMRFAEAAGRMAQVAGAAMTMPRAYYAAAIADGRITDADLAAALAESGEGATPDAVARLRAQALRPADSVAALPTFADLAARATGQDWAGFVVERIGAWAAWRFDAGQAAWGAPWRALPPFAAWRAQALEDRAPEVMGLRGARRIVASLPDTAAAMLEAGVARLGLGPDALERYFHRLLMSVGGWAGWARHLAWEAELRGGADETALDLLAIRLAWDVILCEAFGPFAAGRADAATVPELQADLALQAALERNFQRRLGRDLSAVAAPDRPRPAVQAAFCIDVRSEVFRRALEGVSDEIATFGVAGFFGFALECAPDGEGHGTPHCPVLLAPSLLVGTTGAAARGGAAARAWAAFRTAAVASFAFVESSGWRYAGRLVADALGRAPAPEAHAPPAILPGTQGGRVSGIALDARVALAEGLLRSIALTGPFAPLVLLAGHGAAVVNNPHAAGLACGACGGQTGEANARVAAMVLNDPEVRVGLRARGIAIPAETVFLAGLHDTTTDEVRLFAEDAPQASPDWVRALRAWLARAGAAARAERAARLHLASGAPIDRQILARARDWSQVRPEWGLAGCAAFIAAPRARTAGLDLGGQAFLHSYDWRSDAGFAVLETIMTAPMVVASWINLQYYASTVDNRAFGGGDKTLHNVAGLLGVLEGNGGDLRPGLPWQSLHDGAALVHAPLRLSVFIDAPMAAIDAVIARHDGVRRLLDHGWIHLFALNRDAPDLHRYCGGRRWEMFA